MTVAPHPSLSEAYRSVAVSNRKGFWRRFPSFVGPGFLIAVGYMDPGNWATDIAGGSAFGYTLLSVIMMSNLMAMLLQSLATKLGIVGGLDLAQACRLHYPRPVNLTLWVLCETAIIACDLAELIGAAIALQLLFGLPLLTGVLLTAADVLLILALQRFGFRKLEAVIIALLCTIASCFVAMMTLTRPDLFGIAIGLIPTAEIVTDPSKLYIAIGILGATVMPHNLYLHSSLVQTRAFDESVEGKREALRLATLDSTTALFLAFLINAAILIVAAAAFHAKGQTEVTEIQQAYRLLTPAVGASGASVLFGVALLCAGQNSTFTGTLAGQIVMEGFIGIRLPSWLRRLTTRLIAIVPAAIVAGAYGESGTAQLLLLSQVVLSLQLPFAIIPLIHFTSRTTIMGPYANRGWVLSAACSACAVIVALNFTLVSYMI